MAQKPKKMQEGPVILVCPGRSGFQGTISVKTRQVPGGLDAWVSLCEPPVQTAGESFPRLPDKLPLCSLEHPSSGWAKAKLQLEWRRPWCFFSFLLWCLLLLFSSTVCWVTLCSFPSLELLKVTFLWTLSQTTSVMSKWNHIVSQLFMALFLAKQSQGQLLFLRCGSVRSTLS